MSYQDTQRYLWFMRKRSELAHEWVDEWLRVGRPDKAQQALRRLKVLEELMKGASWMNKTPLALELSQSIYQYSPAEFLINAERVFTLLDGVDMFVEGFREGANWAWTTPNPDKAVAA